MTDWSESLIRAKAAMLEAEQSLLMGDYGEGCRALDRTVGAIGDVFRAIAADERMASKVET